MVLHRASLLAALVLVGAAASCTLDRRGSGPFAVQSDSITSSGTLASSGGADTATSGTMPATSGAGGAGGVPPSGSGGSGGANKKANGANCDAGGECQSGTCADKRCCDQPCEGPCMACREALTGKIDGTCAARKPGLPAPGCPLGLGCDGTGACASCGFKAPAPGMATCPTTLCTGGCVGTTCNVDCAYAKDACKGAQNIACPQGYDCVVDCTADSGCEAAEIACPAGYSCTVKCNGTKPQSCKDLKIQCGSTGTCHVDCSADRCEGTKVTCGLNQCTAGCTSIHPTKVPSFTCGNTCASCTSNICWP